MFKPLIIVMTEADQRLVAGVLERNLPALASRVQIEVAHTMSRAVAVAQWALCEGPGAVCLLVDAATQDGQVGEIQRSALLREVHAAAPSDAGPFEVVLARPFLASELFKPTRLPGHLSVIASVRGTPLPERERDAGVINPTQALKAMELSLEDVIRRLRGEHYEALGTVGAFALLVAFLRDTQVAKRHAA